MRTTILALAFSSLVTAGPIDPPAGPVAPTGTPLGEIGPGTPINGPTTITAPGRYYLTDDLEIFGDAIDIASSDVTLDLRGFTIVGDADLDDARGIDVLAGATGVRIFGGTIREFDGDGINVASTAEALIENVVVRGCGYGFEFRGAARAVGCTARNCGFGFRVLGDATRSIVVTACSADGNGEGFSGSFGSFERCSATGNSINGFNVSSGSVTDCRAVNNNNTGFSLFDVRASKLYAKLNGLVGISANRAMVVESDIIESPTGIIASGFTTIERCHVTGTGQPGSVGIDANSSAKISECNVANAPTAIDAGNGAVVIGNTVSKFPGRVSSNTIVVGSGSIVGVVFDLSTGGTLTSGNPWANILY
ncbi:MAG: right-handed parallel beta-helix repeat-containing protein [Planctomycetota bacterium]